MQETAGRIAQIDQFCTIRGGLRWLSLLPRITALAMTLLECLTGGAAPGRGRG